MANYIYTKAGTPVAFHDGKHIYDLHGRAVGKLNGSQVYCMADHYVGELVNGVILDRRPQRREYPGTRYPHRKNQGPLQPSVR